MRLSLLRQVPCNYGAKFVLTAGSLYFSLDEIKAYSGVYLGSVAEKRPKVNKGKKSKTANKTDDPDKVEEAAEKGEENSRKKKSGIIFPYRNRRVLFRADDFQEAIHLGDVMVEKMIRSKTLLAS
jgi:hypothetical protein